MFWHIVISFPFLILTPWNHEWWNQSLFCLMIFCRYITNILSFVKQEQKQALWSKNKTCARKCAKYEISRTRGTSKHGRSSHVRALYYLRTISRSHSRRSLGTRLVSNMAAAFVVCRKCLKRLPAFNKSSANLL